MNMKLTRLEYTDKSTIGRLEIGKDWWFILEDPVRQEKIYGETAIPSGSYQIVPAYSPSMRRILPLLLAVPNYPGIFIHAGNQPEHTKGCLLPGKERSLDSVWRSVDACAEIFAHICEAWRNKEEVTITIKESREAVA